MELSLSELRELSHAWVIYFDASEEKQLVDRFILLWIFLFLYKQKKIPVGEDSFGRSSRHGRV